MAGTLEVSTIKSGAANTPPVIQDSAGTEVIQGITASATINAVAGTVNAGAFNIGSVTIHGTGDIEVFFSPPMSDAQYEYTVTAGNNGATTYPRVVTNTQTKSVNSIRFLLFNINPSSGAVAAVNDTCVMVHVTGGK